MRDGDRLPVLLLLLDDAAHPLRHELVLRREVTIQGHFVRPRRLGQRFHADTPNADATKQVVGSLENALAWRDARGVGHDKSECVEFGDDCDLTCVLPIGNMPNVTDRYLVW